MSTTEDIVLAYFAAWDETDDGKLRALLEESWADNGLYTSPTAEAVGREALVQRIRGFRQQFAGHRIVCTSGVDGHHGRLRYTWAMVSPEGSRVLVGMDIGEVGSDGRLIRITEFFGPPPPISSSWPADLALQNERAKDQSS